MAWGKSRASPSPEGVKARGKPTAADFTRDAVQKAVWSRAREHPATVIPTAVAVVAIGWTAIIAATPLSIGFIVGGGTVALGSLIWNVLITGDSVARRHVEDLRKLREQMGIREVQEIGAKCQRAGFEEGAKEAREITAAFQALLEFLREKIAHGQNLSAERFKIMAEDTYQEAMGILGQALAIFQALESTDVRTLERDLKAWRRELSNLEADDSRSRTALERKIKGNEGTLANHSEMQQRLQDLLAAANELEQALRGTHLHCTSMVGRDAATMFDNGGAGSRLAQAIEAARRVERRLQGVGQSQRDDAEYLEAGKKVRP